MEISILSNLVTLHQCYTCFNLMSFFPFNRNKLIQSLLQVSSKLQAKFQKLIFFERYKNLSSNSHYRCNINNSQIKEHEIKLVSKFKFRRDFSLTNHKMGRAMIDVGAISENCFSVLNTFTLHID